MRQVRLPDGQQRTFNADSVKKITAASDNENAKLLPWCGGRKMDLNFLILIFFTKFRSVSFAFLFP